MSDDSWFGDTPIRRCATAGLIIILIVVSCWTANNIINRYTDNEVVSIIYPEHIIDAVVPMDVGVVKLSFKPTEQDLHVSE